MDDAKEIKSGFDQAFSLFNGNLFPTSEPENSEDEILLDVDPVSLYFGEDYIINDKIVIRQPTIGDIVKYRENNVYGVADPFITNPTTYRVELWEKGIDWNKLDDYDYFMMKIFTMDPRYTFILFKDIDFTQFQIVSTISDSGEEIKTLYNQTQDIEIDKNTYLKMAKYLQYMFNVTPKVEHVWGKSTKEEVIQEDIMIRNKNKGDVPKSNILSMISFYLNHPGSKYKKNELKDVGIVEFMDSVKRLQIYESTNALLKGAYGGFIDTSKINKNELNFMRDTE